MSERAKQILKEALDMSIDEREEIAEGLLDSLEGPPDPVAEAAWAAEIERRARRVLAGETKGTDWETVRERIWGKSGG